MREARDRAGPPRDAGAGTPGFEFREAGSWEACCASIYPGFTRSWPCVSSKFMAPDHTASKSEPGSVRGLSSKLSARSLQRLSVERPSSPTTQPLALSCGDFISRLRWLAKVFVLDGADWGVGGCFRREAKTHVVRGFCDLSCVELRRGRHGCQPCFRGSRLSSRVPSALSLSAYRLGGTHSRRGQSC